MPATLLPPARHYKWGLLLIVVGGIYLTVIPSVSKYGSFARDGDGVRLVDERRSQGRRRDYYRIPAVVGDVPSNDNGSSSRYDDDDDDGGSSANDDWTNGANDDRTIPRDRSRGDAGGEGGGDSSSATNSSTVAAARVPARTTGNRKNATAAGYRSDDGSMVDSGDASAEIASPPQNSNANATTPSSSSSPRHHSDPRDEARRENRTAASAASSSSSTDIDLVSLTVRDDFFVLFNESAVASWLRHVRNVRSVTFVGPPRDYRLFLRNMKIHYPRLRVVDDNNNNNGTAGYDDEDASPPVRWVNETYWINTYKSKYRCPYPAACQQLIKLHLFDGRGPTAFVGDNVLMVDSDTVWSRDVTFLRPDGTVLYFDVRGVARGEGPPDGPGCTGMDPIAFTEAITAGPGRRRASTLTPYGSCVRPEAPNATGARHIVHHMLFQRDVMADLHDVITARWGVNSVWRAFVTCYGHESCQSRIAEYELYYSFVSNRYPERVRLEHLTNGADYMGSSAVCGGEEMECCRRRGVLLKGCHDHRIRLWKEDESKVGDMCC